MIEEKDLSKVETNAIERYSNRYKKLGVSPRSLGWGCKEDQLERFRVIEEQCNLKGKTIMDIGCGFSDLLTYLNERKINVNYIGVDIVLDFIKYSKKQFPKHQFFNLNIMTRSKELPKADILISLGVINFKLDFIQNFDYSKLFITKAFELTKKILIVDFLSNYRTLDYQKEDFVYYHSPEKIFEFAMTLTNNVRIIHNYSPIPQKEFMVILEKEQEESK